LRESGYTQIFSAPRTRVVDGEVCALRCTNAVLHVQSSPYLDKRKPPDDGSVLAGNERYEGYCVDLSQKLFEMLEMNYELRLVGDGKYGSRLLNGTWDGMVGELTSHVRTRTTELYILC